MLHGIPGLKSLNTSMLIMSRNSVKSTDETGSIAVSQVDTLVPEDESMSRFTATGQPNRAAPPSGLDYIPTGGFATLRPNLLPVKFNDDDIISVPVWVPNTKELDGGASTGYVQWSLFYFCRCSTDF